MSEKNECFTVFMEGRIKFYADHKMYLLSEFCADLLRNYKRYDYNRDRLLRSLKANYDHAPMDYADLIIEIANKIDSFENMLKMTYNKITL